MLKKKNIPTPLIEKKKRKKVKVVKTLESRRLSTLYITWRFTIYLVGILVRRFTGKSDRQKTANELREIFEEFGGFWVKVGQILALRTDLFPKEVCDALRSLQYEAVGFPFDIARSTIESELGAPIDKIFDVFDRKPLAAASIAQIHTAVLRRRKKPIPVVVKIQRPGLADAFKRDLDVIKIFINLLVSLNVASYFRWDEFVAELDKTFREELDFRYEAANGRRMKKNLRAHKVYVPTVYQKYCKRRVLVMEYIDGVLMSDYIKILLSDRARARIWEDENGFDPKKVAERLYLSLFRQIFEDNLYHGDLHPGNIILLRNSKFVLIDLGSTGTLEKELRTIYLNYTNALAEGNFAKAADYFIKFGLDIPKANIPRVRVEMARGFSTWSAKTELKGLSYQEKSLGGASQGVTNVAFGYKIPTNWTFLKITRSLFALDGSVQYLLPDIDIFEIIKKYNKESERRTLYRSLHPENIRASFNRLSNTIDEYNSLILPTIRQRTLPFELTVNKFALSLVVILRTLSYAVLIGGVGFLYVFLYQHYFGVIQLINFAVVDELVRELPYIPYFGCVGILIGGALVFKVLLACAVILERKEFDYKI